MQATERIDIRTTRSVKNLIQRAADRLGLTTSAFVTQHAYQAAQEVLAHDTLVLSERDWETFMAAIENPPAPNAALKALLRGRR